MGGLVVEGVVLGVFVGVGMLIGGVGVVVGCCGGVLC